MSLYPCVYPVIYFPFLSIYTFPFIYLICTCLFIKKKTTTSVCTSVYLFIGVSVYPNIHPICLSVIMFLPSKQPSTCLSNYLRVSSIQPPLCLLSIHSFTHLPVYYPFIHLPMSIIHPFIYPPIYLSISIIHP